MSCIKSSYAIRPSPLRFKLVSGRNGVVRIEWGRQLDQREVEELASATGVRPHGLKDVCEQVRTLLADGEADAVSIKRSVVAAGGSEKTLYRAYRKLGVLKRSVRDEKTGQIASWLMRLPGARV